MGTKKPAKKQEIEFWKGCGFERIDYLDTSGKVCATHWAHLLAIGGGSALLPDPDLNNLFRLAVPVAIEKIMTEQECSSDAAYAILFQKWLQKLELDIPNYEGTLFWAIWEVINGS